MIDQFVMLPRLAAVRGKRAINFHLAGTEVEPSHVEFSLRTRREVVQTFASAGCNGIDLHGRSPCVPLVVRVEGQQILAVHRRHGDSFAHRSDARAATHSEREFFKSADLYWSPKGFAAVM